MRDRPLETLVPDQVFGGRYCVVRCIKSGGMGAVYEVVDQKTDKRRALKIMLPTHAVDAGFRERFEREAKVTGSIESDHIVQVFDAGVDEASGAPFLAMELLRGEELGSIIKRCGRVPPSDVLVYLSQAARALDKTHAAGVVHRDLKPANLFVATRDDGTPCMKILDFGIAKRVERSGEHTTTAVIGTPKYMAPEQITGAKLTGAADVYALGHLAYTMLAGEEYWAEEAKASATDFMFAKTIVEGAKERPSDRAKRRRGATLPPGFDEWFSKATAPTAGERFSPATNATAALAPVLSPPTMVGATNAADQAPELWRPSSSDASLNEGATEDLAGAAATLVLSPKVERTDPLKTGSEATGKSIQVVTTEAAPSTAGRPLMAILGIAVGGVMLVALVLLVGRRFGGSDPPSSSIPTSVAEPPTATMQAAASAAPVLAPTMASERAEPTTSTPPPQMSATATASAALAPPRSSAATATPRPTSSSHPRATAPAPTATTRANKHDTVD